MGDVTGPIHSLPGALHAVPPGATCDQHPTRRAVARVQGETDSLGCEMVDMCQECYDADRAEARCDNPGKCDWCRRDAKHLRYRRDPEEGLRGPVYEVCQECINAQEERYALDYDDSFAAFDDDDRDNDFTLIDLREPTPVDTRDEWTRRREDYDRALRALGRLD